MSEGEYLIACWIVSFFIPFFVYAFIELLLQSFARKSTEERYKNSEKNKFTNETLYFAVVITCIFASLNTLVYYFINK